MNKTDALQALKELHSLFCHAARFHVPRQFEYDREEYLQIGKAYRDFARQVEEARSRLLATGVDVPDNWLAVQTCGSLRSFWLPETEDRPSEKWTEDSGADLPVLVVAIKEIHVARLRLEYAEGVSQPANKDPLSGEERALATLVAHPEWSDTRIAKHVGCHRTTLYKWDKFVAAREALETSKSRFSRTDEL